ncbi:hypothetical protein TcasGA2_TC003686 [Tribolium castaneum]|uniref:Uncharacterized protein n=1 Tax=Tribolium castaneum TaxID=7070 RepID=D6WDM5_TRICA|nr:hypothetical protein TcasGA2_TC003686 [Tribolium castaneum]
MAVTNVSRLHFFHNLVVLCPGKNVASKFVMGLIHGMNSREGGEATTLVINYGNETDRL